MAVIGVVSSSRPTEAAVVAMKILLFKAFVVEEVTNLTKILREFDPTFFTVFLR